eukprot:gene25964-biopygen12363
MQPTPSTPSENSLRSVRAPQGMVNPDGMTLRKFVCATRILSYGTIIDIFDARRSTDALVVGAQIFGPAPPLVGPPGMIPQGMLPQEAFAIMGPPQGMMMEPNMGPPQGNMNMMGPPDMGPGGSPQMFQSQMDQNPSWAGPMQPPMGHQAQDNAGPGHPQYQ